MSFEQNINYQLNKYPGVKKVVKSAYQHAMYAISPKIKSEGNIVRISPNDASHEYFFGYYDKSPWDITDRYMLCMRANDTWSDVSPKEKADILLIDTTLPETDQNRIKKIAETISWNVQQSCMLQWLGPDFSSRILFNDYRDGKYVAVIKEIESGAERVIDAPVYTVSADGKTALTLDFSRLYNLRPGYGYYNIPEKTKGVALPDATAVWKIDLETGEVRDLLTYKDFATFQPRPEMKEAGAVHKVNHLMLSPNGRRFMVLYRWFIGERKYTRLITCNVNGSDMYVLSDDDMVSHCFWKDDEHILAFENKKDGGTGYYLMKDQTQEYRHCWPELTGDGHPSYSPDRRHIVTDSYPDRARIQYLRVMKDEDTKPEIVAKVFSPFKYDNDTRCDLHPRWNHAGDKVCFDSVFEGHRGLYMVEMQNRHTVLNNLTETKEISGLVSVIIPTYKRCDTVVRAIDSVLSQTYSNIEVLVVDDNVPGDENSKQLKIVLEKYSNEPRIVCVGQDVHINGAVARNYGIKAAKGEYVAFLDDDDEWLPEKIMKQVAILRQNDDIDGVTCLWETYRNNVRGRICSQYNAENLQFKVLMREVTVFTSTVIMRKKAIISFGGFDETLARHQDLQFLADATEKSKFKVLNEYLVKLHTDSEINVPNTNKMIVNKRKFFEAEKDIIGKYSRKEQKRIKNAHNYEVAFSALREKNLMLAAKYICKSGLSPRSINDLYKRIKGRK